MTIDKSQLYETFENSLRRSERLTDLATRKALDLPVEEEMQIITHNRPGLGRCGALLLSLAMLAGGGGTALGIVGLLNGLGQRPGQVTQPPPEVASQEFPIQEFPIQEFKVTFWSEEGENLEVENDE